VLAGEGGGCLTFGWSRRHRGVWEVEEDHSYAILGLECGCAERGATPLSRKVTGDRRGQIPAIYEGTPVGWDSSGWSVGAMGKKEGSRAAGSRMLGAANNWGPEGFT
jgi:hypothetical protein